MSVESELYTRLTTHAGLSALVVLRVFPGHLPQGATLPAISYSRVSAGRPSAMGTDIGLVEARFQIDVWDDDYLGLVAVKEQVRAALQRWSTSSGTIVRDTFFENEIDLYEDELEIHHAALDFRPWYEET